MTDTDLHISTGHYVINCILLGAFAGWCTNPLKAELNPVCHLLALLGAHHILHVSRVRVNCTNMQGVT